jgi:hypothetical protein
MRKLSDRTRLRLPISGQGAHGVMKVQPSTALETPKARELALLGLH